MFPALLAGNTIVFKPAEDTPGLAATFMEILIEAGIPQGSSIWSQGIGEEAGAAVVECDAIPGRYDLSPVRPRWAADRRTVRAS